MKKLLTSLCVCALVLMCLVAQSTTAEAATIVDSGNCGSNATYVLDSNGVLTISGTGAMYSYSSYSSVPWYYNRSSVQTVIIETGITSIGSYAFYDCDSLTRVVIGEGVTGIGSYAFYDCDKLTSVTIPSSITSISKYAFYSCGRHDIYYAGNQSQWIGITFESYCYSSTSTTKHYNHVHDYSYMEPTYVEPTCTQNGYIEYTCVHGEKIREKAEAALGHDYTVTVTVVAPTCTKQGYTVAQCIRCTVTQKGNYTNELGHKLIPVAATAATCTEPAKSSGTKCERCNYWGITQTNQGSALGHSFTNYVSNNNATCTANATETAVCDRCNQTNNRTIADSMLDHTFVDRVCIHCNRSLVKITQQPVGTAALNGATARVDVTATGDGLTYRWYMKRSGDSGYTYTGWTSRYYCLTMSELYDGCRVLCMVYDRYGNKEQTVPVTLTMAKPVEIVQQPTNAGVAVGKQAKVTVIATGDELTYAWYVRDVGDTKDYLSSNKTNTYKVVMSSTNNGRKAYCVITDKYGNTVETDTVTLFTVEPLVITKQPTSASAAKGATARTTVTATGDGLTYTWYVRDAKDTKYYVSSNKTNTYKMTVSDANNGRRAYCVIKDQYGNKLQTKTVILSMRNTVQITKQPVSVTVASGKQAKVTVTATGDGLTYKWYYKDPGASSYTYTSSFKGNSYYITMNSARHGRIVLCRVYDQYGNVVQSNSVKLSMQQKVKITKQPVSVTVAKGAVAKVTVNASGDGLVYRWYVKEKGASKYSYTSSFNGNSYYVTMNAARSGRRVLCIVYDKYGNSVQSASALLKMK